MAHVPPKIERTYDRYDYLPEKRDAFQKLSDLVEEIVNGKAEKRSKRAA